MRCPHLTVTLNPKPNVIRITIKIWRFLLPWPRCHLSTEFCENRLSSFRLILLTNKLTITDGRR